MRMNMKRKIPDYVLEVAQKSKGFGSAKKIIESYSETGEIPGVYWFEYMKTKVSESVVTSSPHEQAHEGIFI